MTKLLSTQAMDRMLIGSIALFCCFSLTANLSFYTLKNDFSLLKRHYIYYQENYPILIQASSGSDVELPPEPRVKLLRWKCYLTDNQDYWVNRAIADYFDLKSVVAKGGGGTDPDAPGNGECGG